MVYFIKILAMHEAFSDANWDSKSNDMSTTGYIFILETRATFLHSKR